MMREVQFGTWQEKAAWLNEAAKADALDPQILTFARPFRLAYPDPAARAVAIHRWVRDHIAYRRDPLRDGKPREQFASAAVVLKRRFDDCDGKARLFVALCRAAELNAVIHPVVVDGQFVHVQAAVQLRGAWVRAELILKGVELGEGVDAARRDAAGGPILA
jgi:transglutaminase-like putative cysteine protease